MTREELIARLVAIADERPNTPIGHVVEHELPELRAQAEAMPRVTPEMVAAQAEALEWAYSRLPDGNDIYGAWTTAKDAIEARIKELRAQAEAMNNGAATNAGRAHVNLGTSGSATEDAAPPSAAQPVARVSVQRYKGHNGYENCDWEWNVDIPPDGNYVLYTAPPDLAARVRELEGLLRRAMAQRSKLAQSDHKLDDDINAALAKGE